MMMKKNGMAWTIVLTLMMASMAGCLGGDADVETEQKTINIAGSSTVFPVASAWGQAYSDANSDYTVTVAGGGSGAGASKVCSTDSDSVHIGDMSRDWKTSEADAGDDGFTFNCLDSDITVTQLVVAIDGLSVVVKKGGAADQCITEMGGLSMGQLRWIFTDWTESELTDDGLNMTSITPNNDDDGVREWGILTLHVQIPKSNSGELTPIPVLTSTLESKSSVRTALQEKMVTNLKGSTVHVATKTLLTTTRSSTESPVTRTQSDTSDMPTTKRTPTH